MWCKVGRHQLEEIQDEMSSWQEEVCAVVQEGVIPHQKQGTSDGRASNTARLETRDLQ